MGSIFTTLELSLTALYACIDHIFIILTIFWLIWSLNFLICLSLQISGLPPVTLSSWPHLWSHTLHQSHFCAKSMTISVRGENCLAWLTVHHSRECEEPWASEVRKQKVDRKWSWDVTFEGLLHFFSKASPPKYAPSYQRTPTIFGEQRVGRHISLYGTFPIQITPSLLGPEISTRCSLEFFELSGALFLPAHFWHTFLCLLQWGHKHFPNLSGLVCVTSTSVAQYNFSEIVIVKIKGIDTRSCLWECLGFLEVYTSWFIMNTKKRKNWS